MTTLKRVAKEDLEEGRDYVCKYFSDKYVVRFVGDGLVDYGAYTEKPCSAEEFYGPIELGE